MLDKRIPTSPKKLYITPRPSFKSIRETARQAHPRRSYGYNHHFGIFAKCYQGIFAFGRTASSPTSPEFAYIDISNYKETTYEQG